MPLAELQTVGAVSDALAAQGYLADRPLALAVSLAVSLEQPLLLEGEAGVGKTEVAKALAATTGARLIRLQCHEGIDVHQALYDWDYEPHLPAPPRPRAPADTRGPGAGGELEGASDLYDRRFLVR